MIKGDKLKCIKSVNNLMGWPLFIEGSIYDVLDVSNNGITLNHILYANEYAEFDFNTIEENFIKEE